MVCHILLLILANAVSALTFPISKLSLAYGHPLFLVGIRMVSSGILFLIFEQWRGYTLRWQRHYLILLVALSFFNVFITNCLQFWALQYTTASKALLIFNTAPFIAAVLSYFLYNETITLKKVIALIIAFVGFLPVLWTANDTTTMIGMPEIALLLGALTSVIGWLVMKKLLQIHGSSLVMLNGISMLVGGLMFFPASFFIEGKGWYTIIHLPMLGLLLLVLIVANNIINYNCYAYFLRHFSATLLFLISFTAPLFSLFFAWLFLGEKIGFSFVVTVVIVSVGLILYYQEEKRLQEAKKPFL